MRQNLFWFFWLTIWPIFGVCGPLLVAEFERYTTRPVSSEMAHRPIDVRRDSAARVSLRHLSSENRTRLAGEIQPQQSDAAPGALDSVRNESDSSPLTKIEENGPPRIQSAPLPVAQVSLPETGDDPANTFTDDDLSDSEPLPPVPPVAAPIAAKSRNRPPVISQPVRPEPEPAVSEPFQPTLAEPRRLAGPGTSVSPPKRTEPPLSEQAKEIQRRIHEKASQQASQRRARLAARSGRGYRQTDYSARGYSSGGLALPSNALAKSRR